MTELIIGGSGTGKSRFAEKEAYGLYMENSKDPLNKGDLIYLAAMEKSGEEAERRIRKHRENRSGYGFRTIEHERNIGEALKDLRSGDTVLLEALSVLYANEMFIGPDKDTDPFEAADRVLSGLSVIFKGVRNLVIVSDDVFRDGRDYDGAVEGYLKGLGFLHREIAETVDKVLEISAGTPTVWKEPAGI